VTDLRLYQNGVPVQAAVDMDARGRVAEPAQERLRSG